MDGLRILKPRIVGKIGVGGRVYWRGVIKQQANGVESVVFSTGDRFLNPVNAYRMLKKSAPPMLMSMGRNGA